MVVKTGFGAVLPNPHIDVSVITSDNSSSNSISPSAYHLFNKIEKLCPKWKVKSRKIGKANNNGMGYSELDDLDVQHYEWEKE